MPPRNERKTGRTKKKPPLRTASFLLLTREPPLVWALRRGGSSSPVVGGSSLSGYHRPFDGATDNTVVRERPSVLSPSYGHTIKTTAQQVYRPTSPYPCGRYSSGGQRCLPVHLRGDVRESVAVAVTVPLVLPMGAGGSTISRSRWIGYPPILSERDLAPVRRDAR